MNLTKALTRFVEANAVLREAALGYSLAPLSAIDSDEYLYRRLTQTTRDLGGLTSERQREIAYFLADTNPFARRIIQIMRDYVVVDANEWTITAPNEAVQELLDAHWRDPLNAWPEKLESRVRELAIAGEQCYTATTGPDGLVRLGYVDPGYILDITQDEHNIEIQREVVLKRQVHEQDSKRLKVINYNPVTGAYEGMADGDQGKYVAACWFWALNKPVNAKRGRSDLLALSDALDMTDRFHFNRMERSALINAFFWDVTVNGADEAKLIEFAKGQPAPKPGAARYHNEAVKWEAVTPNLGGQDASEEGRLMRVPLLAGSGIPDHWLVGQGDNANRASAYEMSDPPMRAFKTRQLFVVQMLTSIFHYQIDEALRLGKLKPSDDVHDFRLNVPEMSSRDMTKATAALREVAQVLLAVDSLGLLSRATKLRLLAFVTGQLGFSIDPEAEEEAREAEEGEDLEADLGGLKLPVVEPEETVPA